MVTANIVCLGCKFSSVKLEILVPENSELTDFAERTQDFSARLLAITREKPLHYSLKYSSATAGGETLNFTVSCSCTLNLDKEDCLTYRSADENEAKIRRVQYIKPDAPDELTIEL